MGFLKKVFGRSSKSPEEVNSRMRSMALNVRFEDLGLTPDPKAPVYGVIMETGMGDAVATLVCMGDGTVSLYFSTGGGIIGAGQHADVRNACLEMLGIVNEVADDFLRASYPVSDFPMPADGEVFFYLLTIHGVYHQRAEETELKERRHPFAALFNNCHVVMSEVRYAHQRMTQTN